ncbi:MAG TPA: peptidoglycan recognition family protein, partial [Sedimentisphaerales bacterium]|nr:peptidoglycan recognition family protein [Sedimentisphaerales bacterium]
MVKWILAGAGVLAVVVLSGCVSAGYSTPKIVSWPQPAPVFAPPPPQAARVPFAAIPSNWIPPASLERRGRWEGIVIHHSATASGNAAVLDRLHKDRGWDGLGYAFVITNGDGGPDGMVEVGWRWTQQREGAHARVSGDHANYWNERTIGICLVGNFELTRPTEAQYESLARLVSFLQARYNIPTSKIRGHG